MNTPKETPARDEKQISSGRRTIMKAAWSIPAIAALGTIPAFGRDPSGCGGDGASGDGGDGALDCQIEIKPSAP